MYIAQYQSPIKFNRKKAYSSLKHKMKVLVPEPYFKLVKLNDSLTQLNRKEKMLIQQIHQIDTSLERKFQNMMYQNGILFSEGISKQLIQAIFTFIQQANVEVIQRGFQFAYSNKLSPNGKILFSPSKRLAQKLKQKSQERQRLYEQEIQKLRRPIINSRWQYFSMGSPKSNLDHYQSNKSYGATVNKNISKRIKTENSNHNQQFDRNQISSLQENNKCLIRNKSIKLSELQQDSNRFEMLTKSFTSKSKIISQSLKKAISFNQNHTSITKLAIKAKLEKENQIISIWLPPSSYPQFYGFMSIDLRQRQSGLKYCLIKKYFWLNRALTRRFFNCIMDWISKQFVFVQILALFTSKQCFDSIFAKSGWKLNNWVREDRVRIQYKRNLL